MLANFDEILYYRRNGRHPDETILARHLQAYKATGSRPTSQRWPLISEGLHEVRLIPVAGRPPCPDYRGRRRMEDEPGGGQRRDRSA